MDSVNKGYTIKNVIGLKMVDIVTTAGYVEIVLVGDDDSVDSFDLNGFRDYVADLGEALCLAEQVNNANGYGH